MTKKSSTENSEHKGHGCLIAFLIFLFLFFSIIGGGYWIYKKITAGLSKQIDLNVAYSQDDLNSFSELLQTSVSNALANEALEDNAIDMDISFTSEQASALVNSYITNIAFMSFENTQIKFTDDLVKVSTLVEYSKYTIPFYASGDVSTTVNNRVSVNLYDVKIGDVTLPKALQDYVENGLDEFINEKLSSEGASFKVEDVTVGNNILNFKGLIPIDIADY